MTRLIFFLFVAVLFLGCLEKKGEENETLTEFWRMELPDTQPVDPNTQAQSLNLIVEVDTILKSRDFAEEGETTGFHPSMTNIEGLEVEIHQNCQFLRETQTDQDTDVQAQKIWSENRPAMDCALDYIRRQIARPKLLSSGVRYDLTVHGSFVIRAGSPLDAISSIATANFEAAGFVSQAQPTAVTLNQASGIDLTGEMEHKSLGVLKYFYKLRYKYQTLLNTDTDEATTSGRDIKAYGVRRPEGWVVLLIQTDYPMDGGRPIQVVTLNGEVLSSGE